MPAIRHLLRRRECGLDDLGVGSGAISGNDLNGRVGAQPIGNRSRLSAFKYLDWFTPLKVDDDRSVVMPAPDRPVVDADDSRCGRAAGGGRSVQLPQQGVGADAQAQFDSEPSGRLTAQGLTKRMQGSSVRPGTTLMSARQGVDILAESASQTLRIHAFETSHLDAQHDVLVENGALGQATLIASMQTGAPAAAGRARCRTYGTVRLHLQRSSLLDAANDPLAHLGEDAINNPDSAGHHISSSEVTSG